MFIFAEQCCRKMNVEVVKGILKDKCVGIAGCGGLGSNAAVALVRSGIGRLILADFDRVEVSNLNRQFYFRDQIGMLKVEALRDNLLAINPECEIEIHQLHIETSDVRPLFNHCQVLIEAFDQAASKAMLVEAMISNLPDVPMILGNGMAGIGGFSTIGCSRWSDNIYVCGDLQTEISPTMSPMAARVGIVANLQADTAIQLLLGVQPDCGSGIVY